MQTVQLSPISLTENKRVKSKVQAPIKIFLAKVFLCRSPPDRQTAIVQRNVFQILFGILALSGALDMKSRWGTGNWKRVKIAWRKHGLPPRQPLPWVSYVLNGRCAVWFAQQLSFIGVQSIGLPLRRTKRVTTKSKLEAMLTNMVIYFVAKQDLNVSMCR